MEFIYPACIERERKKERKKEGEDERERERGKTNEIKITCLDMHDMELGNWQASKRSFGLVIVQV